MQKRIINFLIFAIICGAIYGLLSYHIVFYFEGAHKEVRTLKKSSMTLEDTFVNVRPTEFRTPKKMLENDQLRQDGIGDVLVELEIITQETKDNLERAIEAEKK